MGFIGPLIVGVLIGVIAGSITKKELYGVDCQYRCWVSWFFYWPNSFRNLGTFFSRKGTYTFNYWCSKFSSSYFIFLIYF